MKIQCQCGEMIVDQTDAQSHKAHFIPDQDWLQLLDSIDEAIEKSGPAPTAKAAACMQVRSLLGQLARRAWQCRTCGSIYIEDQQRTLQRLLPTTEPGPHVLFRSHPAC